MRTLAERIVSVVSLAIAASALIAWVWWAALPVIDDAAISISYGLTFWEGFGFRLTHFSPRVEGFTSALWAVWCGLGARVGIDTLGFAHWSGPFFAVLGGVWLSRGAFSTRLPAGAFAVLACVAFPSLAFWLSSGMETGLQVAALALALSVTLSSTLRPKLTGAILGALPLVRPEYLVLGGALLGVWALPHLRSKQWRVVLLAGVAWAGTLALLFGLRVAYFADLLPNTYYIKRNWDFNGANYVGSFLKEHLALAVAFVVGVIGLGFAGWWRHALALLVVCGAGLQFGGYRGDWMREWRFLVPLIPFFAVPALLSWSAAADVAGTRRLVARVLAVIAVALVVTGAVMQRQRHAALKASPEFPATFVMENARRFKKQFDDLGMKRPQVGLPDIGGVGLTFREGVVIDVAGLADYSVAHARGVKMMEDYVVNEGPPVLVDAHGPSGHVRNFTSLRNFIPNWGGGTASLPLTPTEDPRCPGLRARIDTATSEVVNTLQTQLSNRQPIEALRTWNCLFAYADDDALPPMWARHAWANEAKKHAKSAEPEVALRYLSFAAVVGDDVWARRAAEKLRLQLFGTP